MVQQVGKISSITRYPVKSFAGEQLETCKIEKYGLDGDRVYAFYDASKEGWESFITARQIPTMLAFKTSLYGKELKVVAPNGQVFGWNEELLAEIQKYSPQKVSMTKFQAPNPVNPELLSVDSASILIATDVTLRKLEALCGEKLDPRRFRANFIVSIDGEAMNESDWMGRRLSIGSAELQVDQYCERCSMITIDPDTLVREPSLLKKVYDEMNLHFGVYASVTKTGDVRVGNKVILLDT
ncbi:MOSC domain-containing protein [Neobacillus kokaensis]|uniref:Molybdenum cofactor sulfurase n=1 Tax=Neobacillus kokaensis TaxID=2759023 RepID=A0ABQ3N8P6_9BACI|nr:MOSC N-terminal beta barrel domain-containing protein [Neobacillus kokaensis]GHH98950.1 molybdenum cofactor sulfurase [Neobacillus kokaensis]